MEEVGRVAEFRGVASPTVDVDGLLNVAEATSRTFTVVLSALLIRFISLIVRFEAQHPIGLAYQIRVTP